MNESYDYDASAPREGSPVPTTEQLFEQVKRILAGAIGQECAVTIGTLCAQCNVHRRTMELLFQLYLDEFPFLLCSGINGYFQPTTDDDLNHYIQSIESRCRCLYLRKRTTIRKALAAKRWTRVGKYFESSPKQLDLIAP